MPNVHTSTHPLVAHKLTLLRSTATDTKAFRELVYEISVLLAYEATRALPTQPVPVTTPLTETTGQQLAGKVAIASILRAGLGLVNGFVDILPHAQVWHIGLKRDEHTLKPTVYYANQPPRASVDTCYLLDPMLATGGSAIYACSLLKDWGVKRLVYVGLIAAPEGLRRLHARHSDVDVYVAAVDSHLNDIGYIVPGLGDAGDRQFGTL